MRRSFESILPLGAADGRSHFTQDMTQTHVTTCGGRCDEEPKWSGLRIDYAVAQFLNDFLGGVSGFIEPVRWKRDRADSRMSASPITLADLSQVHELIGRRPWIGPYRYLSPEAASAEPYAIDGVRVKVVRNELVIPFKVLIGYIEINRAVLLHRSFA